METSTSIYQDIALRTNGDIYIGVVGPVRTGKSTFIKRFMETLVIPNIDNVYMKERARDELPQSGSGRTIMTAEPKFVPEEAVAIRLDGGASLSVRLIDCVGYMVNGAVGQFEDNSERMVTTPWFDHEISLTEAAEKGTQKVISEHSTIGLVVTTDGTVCGIPREEYVAAEERVVSELLEIGKPFVVLINSASPSSAHALREELTEKYGVTCICANCLELTESDIENIIRSILGEFPVSELGVFLPSWVNALPAEHEVRKAIFNAVAESAADMHRIRDVARVAGKLSGYDEIDSAGIVEMSMGTGEATISVAMPEKLYYDIISEQSGFSIHDDGDLMALLAEIAGIKSEYDRVSGALKDVREKGYGIVMPTAEEMRLEDPEIVKQGGKFGVKLKASAPSVYMLSANIETEVSPALGGGDQVSEEILGFLLQGFDGDVSRIWESNIFGKSLYEIASDGLIAKIRKMPEDAHSKLQETLQRIINEGSGGLICIIL